MTTTESPAQVAGVALEHPGPGLADADRAGAVPARQPHPLAMASGDLDDRRARSPYLAQFKPVVAHPLIAASRRVRDEEPIDTGESYSVDTPEFTKLHY